MCKYSVIFAHDYVMPLLIFIKELPVRDAL